MQKVGRVTSFFLGAGAMLASNGCATRSHGAKGSASVAPVAANTAPGPKPAALSRDASLFDLLHAPAATPEAASTDESAPAANIAGLWVWRQTGVLPDGDESSTMEVWRLEQSGNKIKGFYEQLIHRSSKDGQAFRCSRTLEVNLATRFTVVGEIRGNNIVLLEIQYETAPNNPCDDGQRRLSNYIGEINEGEIRLLTGEGQLVQVLKRARPMIPTQRF